MNTKTLVIVGIGVSLGIVALLNIVIWSLEVRREQLSRPVPSITPTPLPDFANRQEITKIPTAVPQLPLAVMDTYVEGGSESASLLPEIKIVFNQTVTRSAVVFAIRPEEEFFLTTQGATASATFDTPLQPGTTYTYIVRTENQLAREYSFTTESTTAPEDVLRVYRPDIFISERTPFENETFAIRAQYNQDRRRYALRVTPKSRNRDTVDAAVREWLIGNGLTEEQIDTLLIGYTQ